MSVALIKKDEAEQHIDPLRAALSAAITAEAEARAAVVLANENLRRGHSALAAGQADLERAKHLVEKARDRDGRAAAASIRKTAGAPTDASKTVRGARLRVQELEDDIEISEAAIGRLQDDLVQAEAAVERAVVDTMAARNAVLAPICRELIERARDFRRGLAVCRALLIELLNDPARGAPELNALGGMRVREQITAPLAGLRTEAEQVSMLNATAGEQEAVAASLGELRRAVSNLMADAATELPPLP